MQAMCATAQHAHNVKTMSFPCQWPRNNDEPKLCQGHLINVETTLFNMEATLYQERWINVEKTLWQGREITVETMLCQRWNDVVSRTFNQHWNDNVTGRCSNVDSKTLNQRWNDVVTRTMNERSVCPLDQPSSIRHFPASILYKSIAGR